MAQAQSIEEVIEHLYYLWSNERPLDEMPPCLTRAADAGTASEATTLRNLRDQLSAREWAALPDIVRRLVPKLQEGQAWHWAIDVRRMGFSDAPVTDPRAEQLAIFQRDVGRQLTQWPSKREWVMFAPWWYDKCPAGKWVAAPPSARPRVAAKASYLNLLSVYLYRHQKGNYTPIFVGFPDDRITPATLARFASAMDGLPHALRVKITLEDHGEDRSRRIMEKRLASGADAAPVRPACDLRLLPKKAVTRGELAKGTLLFQNRRYRLTIRYGQQPDTGTCRTDWETERTEPPLTEALQVRLSHALLRNHAAVLRLRLPPDSVRLLYRNAHASLGDHVDVAFETIADSALERLSGYVPSPQEWPSIRADIAHASVRGREAHDWQRRTTYTIGNGPLGTTAMSRLLDSLKVHTARDARADTLVVGSVFDDSTHKELSAFCARHAGHRIRLLSQEMWLCELLHAKHETTWSAPWTFSFVKPLIRQHGVFEFLQQAWTGWVQQGVPAKLHRLVDSLAGLGEDGLLSSVGYHVGYSGDEPVVRREALDTAYAVPETEAILFGKRWGRERSPTRLRQMGITLGKLIDRAKTRASADMSAAIRDWQEDLEYLRTKYYTPAMQWRWPPHPNDAW